MRSRASGGSCGDSVAATSAETMSSLRRRAICTQRARSTERSDTGGRPSARTTAPASFGSASRRIQASTSRTSVWAKKSASPTVRKPIARSSKATPTSRPSSRSERTSTPMRSGSQPARTRRSTSAATACACARSSSACQKRTVPPGAPATGAARRPGIGSTTATAASSTRCGQRCEVSSRATAASGCAASKSRTFLAAAARRRRAAWSSSAADGDRPVLGREQLDEQRRREAEVGELVDEHVAVALGDPRADVRALAQHRDRAQHELARVQRALFGEQPVVVEIQAGELDLARGAVAGRVVLGRQRLRPGGVVGGRDELVLEPVDAIDDARQQDRRAPADVVAAQVQVVHAVEQHRETIGARRGREERIDARLGGLVAQQPRAELAHAVDRELLVRAVDRVLDAAAQRGRGGAGRAQHEDRLRRRAPRHEPGEARDENRRLARPGASQHEHRAAVVRHRAPLGRGEVRRRGGGR